MIFGPYEILLTSFCDLKLYFFTSSDFTAQITKEKGVLDNTFIQTYFDQSEAWSQYINHL